MKIRRPRKERLRKAAFIKRLRVLLGRVLLFIVACGMFFWIGNQVYRFYLVNAVKTVEAKEGNLAASYSGQAIILRNETVVRAPRPGYLVRFLPEGSLVRSGQVVAGLKPPPSMEKNRESINLPSPTSGFVCYHPDGWEGVLVPEQWSRLDLAGLFKNFKGDIRDHSQVSAAGEPVFKIIDNLSEPYLVIKLDKVGKDHLSQGDAVELQWSGGSGKGKIVGTKAVGEILLVVAEVLQAQPGLPDDRLLNLKVIKPECEGIIIPAEALVQHGHSTGVFTYSPLGFRFLKVEVRGRLCGRVAVTGIDPGLEIVVNPWVATRIQKDI